jgi:hypothetical protein
METDKHTNDYQTDGEKRQHDAELAKEEANNAFKSKDYAIAAVSC